MPITQFMHISTMSVLIIKMKYIKEHKIMLHDKNKIMLMTACDCHCALCISLLQLALEADSFYYLVLKI